MSSSPAPSTFVVRGGRRLSGSVTVQGSKNAALALIPASLLVPGVVRLRHMPRIRDVADYSEILTHLGVHTQWDGDTFVIDSTRVHSADLRIPLVSRQRASLMLLGPLLARTGSAILGLPGGDAIGKRPIDSHIEAMEALGAKTLVRSDYLHMEAPKLRGGISHVVVAFSVTGTENALMAAMGANGPVELRGCAVEPHVLCLVEFLRKLGARIETYADHRFVVYPPVAGWMPTTIEHDVIPDYLVAGTLAAAAALCGDNVTLQRYPARDLDVYGSLLQHMGVHLQVDEQAGTATISAPAGGLRAIPVIKTGIHPMLGTDLQSVMGVLQLVAQGRGELFETIYESRFGYLQELAKMGADSHVLNPHLAVTNGGHPLHGATVTALDVRAGAACVLAGLIATGDTTIRDVYHIQRGYADLPGQLRALGADITEA